MALKLYSTGISLDAPRPGYWSATVSFSDLTQFQEGCAAIEGTIGPRSISSAIDEVLDQAKHAAESIGVEWIEPCIYVPEAVEAELDPDMPGNWRELVAAQCVRLGWQSIYESKQPRPHAEPAPVA